MAGIADLIIRYRYLILFPIAAIEGPMVSLLVGFFIYLGYLKFLPTYLILMLGDIIPDSIYYYIGRFGNQKKVLEKYSSNSEGILSNIKFLEHLWQNHGKKTMFLSKLAYGLSIPFLISAGLVKMPYRRFLLYAVPVSLFQYGVITLLGYSLGHSYQLAEKYIKYTYMLIAVILIIFVVGYILISKYARKQIKKMEQENNINND